jgi:hypothetical protein
MGKEVVEKLFHLVVRLVMSLEGVQDQRTGVLRRRFADLRMTTKKKLGMTDKAAEIAPRWSFGCGLRPHLRMTGKPLRMDKRENSQCGLTPTKWKRPTRRPA